MYRLGSDYLVFVSWFRFWLLLFLYFWCWFGFCVCFSFGFGFSFGFRVDFSFSFLLCYILPIGSTLFYNQHTTRSLTQCRRYEASSSRSFSCIPHWFTTIPSLIKWILSVGYLLSYDSFSWTGILSKILLLPCRKMNLISGITFILYNDLCLLELVVRQVQYVSVLYWKADTLCI